MNTTITDKAVAATVVLAALAALIALWAPRLEQVAASGASPTGSVLATPAAGRLVIPAPAVREPGACKGAVPVLRQGPRKPADDRSGFWL